MIIYTFQLLPSPYQFPYKIPSRTQLHSSMISLLLAHMLIISFAPRRIQHTGRPDTQLRLLKEPNEELVLLREGLIGGVLGEETAPVTELEGLVDCGIEGGPLLRVGCAAGVKDRLPALFVEFISFHCDDGDSGN